MDGGPFRAPQPSERRVSGRPEPVSRQPEAAQPVAEELRTNYRSEPVHQGPKKRKLFKRVILPIIIVVVIVGLVLTGWSAWSRMQNAGTGIDTSKYQAVFFTNGQVYFGKLQAFNDNYMKLTDIFYLQTPSTDSKNPQQTSTDQSNVQLIKLGNEVHGPQDEMVLSKAQVLFYENLKPDGKVAQSIAQYKSTNK